MILYGGKHKSSRTPASRVSYRSFYDEPRERRAPVASQAYNYDDVILDSRGDAEEVLDRLNEIIDQYQIASVADFYELVGVSGTYTDNRYGWTNLSGACVERTRDGYQIRLPRALPIK